ncbi:DedA family protein [Streptacidiphilus cavernicola]|uniref:DedA family protein n=1 Tax=Streptacidiphilus cavernicola TaxID=3342716 RepID=A0ABV6W5C7_9ACTN
MSAALALLASSWFFVAALLAVMSDAFIPLVPSGTLVIAATLHASETHTSPLLLGVGVAIASFSGDLLLLKFARRGANWAQRRLERKPGAASAAASVLEALETKRARTIVTARFVPGGRTVLDLAVGTTSTPPRRFLRWSAVSASVWATYIVGLGFLNEHTFNTTWLSFAVSCVAATAISAVIARVVQRQRRLARKNAAAAVEPVVVG